MSIKTKPNINILNTNKDVKIQEGTPKTQILGIRSNLRGIINYEPSSRDTLLYFRVAFLNRKSASTHHHGRAP